MAFYLDSFVDSLTTCWSYVFPVLLGLFLTISVYNKHRFGSNKHKKFNEQADSKNNSVKLDAFEYVEDLEHAEHDPVPAPDAKSQIPYSGATVTLTKDPLESANRFYAIASDRRSVRKFSSRPVDVAILERCIQVAGTAPSCKYTEPWTFCLVSDPTIKRNIRSIIEAEEYIIYSQRRENQHVTDLRPIHTREYLTEAPHLVLVFKQIYGYEDSSSGTHKKQYYYNDISTSIATGMLLCALQCAGLSSLVTTPLHCGSIFRTLLERPPSEELLAVIPVGYPADDCTISDLQRKPLEDILVRY